MEALMKRIPALVFSAIILCFNGEVFADELWEQVSGLNGTNLKEVAADNFNKGVIYAASEEAVYKTENFGKSWAVVFSEQGDRGGINCLSISEGGVFICSKNGLFKSNDNGLNWKRLFKGMGQKENDVACIAFSKDKRMFIGTRSGLFESDDNGLMWKKDASEAGGFSVRWLAFLNDIIILATEQGVYKNSGAGWKRTFVTSREDAGYDIDSADEGALTAFKPVNCVFVNKDKVFLATDSGVFISEDNADTWSRFSREGLLSLCVKRLLFSENLYAATDRGVFVFLEENKLWQPLYKGMDTKETRDIALDQAGNIWAASKKGLYRSGQAAIASIAQEGVLLKERQGILSSFEGEPNISDVQKAAIEYAEVHPNKIREWRKSANRKALLPSVSVGFDRYVTDYWHWDSGTNPDTLQKGKDAVSWDVTMSWNMGELIWNNDQTSIDTRSKLMVELRDDVMNEVTRTYFERRRLQIEMLVSPPNDLKIGLEKELRLQELTADIDGLTGGYFSAQVD